MFTSVQLHMVLAMVDVEERSGRWQLPSLFHCMPPRSTNLSPFHFNQTTHILSIGEE